jgi:hypothetical protein
MTDSGHSAGTGTEGVLGVHGPVEDEIAFSQENVLGVTRVGTSVNASQYWVRGGW